MSHLRIQVLGPFRLWNVDNDGYWHPLPPKGDGSAAVLSALVFDQAPFDWERLATRIWDEAEVAEKPEESKQNVRAAVSRARTVLAMHEAVLPGGPGWRLAGRSDEPRLVRIDWDDFLELQRNGYHDQALSLVAGLPLPEIAETNVRIGNLVRSVRAEVSVKVNRSLRELGRPLPDDVTLSTHLAEFRSALPDDWRVMPAPKAPPAPIGRPARRPPPELGGMSKAELFEPCHEGRARLARELDEAASDQAATWWKGGMWLGKYFAYWFKTLPTACEEIAFTYVDDIYDSARLTDEDVDALKPKATLIGAPKQLGDNPAKQVICGTTNWGLAHIWAKSNSGKLLEHPSNLSVFGVRGRPVYPGILGVHPLVQTSDGFILFGLRSPDVDFHELTWSASFEESVSVDAREFTGPLTGDRTVLDPIIGGLHEEWGIEEDAVLDSSCLAIGREWVREQDEKGSRLTLSPTILAACRLKLSLDEVWASLDAVGTIRDRDEHAAWAGVHFENREQVLRFVAAGRGRRDNEDLLRGLAHEAGGGVEVRPYPGGAVENVHDRGLMPTSAARLVLASAWLDSLD